jgi:hypothetical protein
MMWGKKQTYSRQELRDTLAREITDARAMRDLWRGRRGRMVASHGFLLQFTSAREAEEKAERARAQVGALIDLADALNLRR